MNFYELAKKVRLEEGASVEDAEAGADAMLRMCPEASRAQLLEPLPEENIPGIVAALRTLIARAKANPAAALEDYKKSFKEVDRMRYEALYNSYLFKKNMERRGQPLTQGHWKREDLMRIGMFWWQFTLAHCAPFDTDGFSNGIQRGIDSMPPDQAELASQWVRTEDGNLLAFMASHWTHYAFPAVRYQGHKYAAALMSTGIPKDIELHAPWPTFLIEVPDRLLSVASSINGEQVEVRYIMACFHPTRREDEPVQPGCTFVGWCEDGTTVYRIRQTYKELLSEPEELEDMERAAWGAFQQELSKQDDRVLNLLTRLLVNTCVLMTEKKDVKPLGHPASDEVAMARKTREPVCRVYQVGRPVTVDCREEVRQYVHGKRRGTASLQWLVRGHLRNQPHGPQKSLRKVIWIEPHFKGPEDAPILVRSHDLEKPLT
jgi:hypothetical protein